VVAACAAQGVPVTLKMRTGWSTDERNALALARAAQDEGIAMLVVHGRTREQGYAGRAEHDQHHHEEAPDHERTVTWLRSHSRPVCGGKDGT
jgi:tRNA-dihydrouridine synthase